MEGCITMTMNELDRFEIINKSFEKRIKVAEAAEILGLSIRQTHRWSKRLKLEGPEGLISKKRGALGNHSLPKQLKQEALKLIEAKYHDFGPTLAHEYLTKARRTNDIRQHNSRFDDRKRFLDSQEKETTPETPYES